MQTKTITVKTDWLYEIDGMSVAQAIKYLKTLDQSYTLNYYMEGDTYGCEVVANLSYEVPMTDDEIYSKLEKHYTKEIKIFEEAKEKHLKDGRTSRAESCEINLIRLRTKFSEIKRKYNKE